MGYAGVFIDKLFYIYARLLKKGRGVAIKGSDIHKTSKVESGSTIIDTVFEKHSFCGYDCLFNNCEVGSFTSIANKVTVGGSAHPMHFVSMSPVFLSHKDSVRTKFSMHDFHDIPRTKIGNDVWIGEGVFVKAGVEIGHGSVVGMGSVVTKDVAPYSIVAGNPAQFIRRRFSEDQIADLLDIEWWAFSDNELRHSADLFKDPELFIEYCKGKR